MAKPNMWIIVKILDHSKAWNHRRMRWYELANATKFTTLGSKNYLLPLGGEWMPWAEKPNYDAAEAWFNYDWSEGDLITLPTLLDALTE